MNAIMEDLQVLCPRLDTAISPEFFIPSLHASAHPNPSRRPGAGAGDDCALCTVVLTKTLTLNPQDVLAQELETMALRVMEAQQATRARLDARGEQMAGVSAEYERKKVEVRRYEL